MSIVFYILLGLLGIYALLFLFMNISLFFLKRDYWLPLYVYFDDILRGVYEDFVEDKKIYLNPFDIRAIWPFIFHREKIESSFPFKDSYKWIKNIGRYDESYDHLLHSLIETRKFGDALSIAAFICYRSSSVPIVALFACESFIDNNAEIHLGKYPEQVATDIYTVFVAMYNLYYSQVDSPYQRRFKKYIEDPKYLHVDEKYDPVNDCEVNEDKTLVNIYKFYSDKIDKDYLVENDEILYNGIFKIHISSIERNYAQELDKTNLNSMQVMARLLERGMFSAATLMASEIADRDYFIRKKGYNGWEDYVVFEDISFARLLNIIVREQFEDFTYLDDFVNIIIKCYQKNDNVFTEQEIQDLLKKRDELKGIEPVDYGTVKKKK